MLQRAANESSTVRPRVGIILTTYNGHDFIREQIDSLLNQVGVSLHIYVFDDRSTDDTLSTLRAYSEARPGVFSIFQNEENSGGTGLNVLRNIVKVSSEHDFVALADQDDVWLPDKLQAAIGALTREGSDLYFSNLMAWDGQEQILGVVDKAAKLRGRDHLFGGGSAGCTYVMSASFFSRLKGVLRSVDLRDVRRISHDWIIYFVARHYGHKVTASQDALIKYRIHSHSQYGGMSLGGVKAALRKLDMLRDGFLREQIDNSLLFVRNGSEDQQILLACTKGRWARLKVLLKYRFSLVRKNSRIVPLAIALLGFR